MDDSGSSFRFKCKSFMKEREREREREREQEKEKVCVCEFKHNRRNEQKHERPLKLAGSAVGPNTLTPHEASRLGCGTGVHEGVK
jgi:hypothetical protein